MKSEIQNGGKNARRECRDLNDARDEDDRRVFSRRNKNSRVCSDGTQRLAFSCSLARRRRRHRSPPCFLSRSSPAEDPSGSGGIHNPLPIRHTFRHRRRAV